MLKSYTVARNSKRQTKTKRRTLAKCIWNGYGAELSWRRGEISPQYIRFTNSPCHIIQPTVRTRAERRVIIVCYVLSHSKVHGAELSWRRGEISPSPCQSAQLLTASVPAPAYVGRSVCVMLLENMNRRRVTVCTYKSRIE